MCSDPVKVSNYFNNFFISKPNLITSSLPNPSRNFSHLVPFNDKSIFIAPATSNEVYATIGSLKNRSKLYDIPLKMLKLSIRFSEVLARIFNIMIETGIYPECLKCAKITPVYKSGQRSCVENFRPIAILPILDKIFEKLLYGRLESFLNMSNLITKSQFGFQKNSSTILAIEYFLSNAVKSFENCEFLLVVFADLRKAFECVDLDILLEKLYRYGIRGLAHKLFSSFLKNRKQKVLINGVQSKELLLNRGVPQGSCLGPILFLIFINDLPNLFKQYNEIYCLLYADDTSLMCRGSNLDQSVTKINLCLSMFADWLNYNKLSLNATKTKYMIFSNKHIINEPVIHVYNLPIDLVFSYKYLGLLLDSKLNYNEQRNIILTRLNMFVSISARVSYCFNINAARSFYFSHIYSSITYGIIIWGAKITFSSSCQTLIKKHLKIICNLFWRFAHPYCCKGLILQKMKLLNFTDIYKFNLCCLMHKSIRDIGSSLLCKYLSTIYIQDRYNMRDLNNFPVQFCRVDAVKNNYLNQAVVVWRSLPNDIRIIDSYSKFKKELTKYFISFYCCCEH